MIFCRGLETRRKLKEEYDLKPIAHVRLLTGQQRRSCTGNLLTDSYYCFSYKKHNGKDEGDFLCGEHAATSFLELTGHKKIPLFDPLSHQGTLKAGKNIDSISSAEKWNPIAKQLYDAINLLLICWGSMPGQALRDISEKLLKYKNCPPFPSQIKAVNIVISKDKKERTLNQMLDELRIQNKSLRQFDFSLLTHVLKEEKVEKTFFFKY
ncbi:hypothetical protein B9G55_18155 [Saccharibacillus sp. O16]|nr:hypothetical protein B9G55_18155 [Saccharibacillus sp. O16]